jgi:hypothetical protein
VACTTARHFSSDPCSSLDRADGSPVTLRDSRCCAARRRLPARAAMSHGRELRRDHSHAPKMLCDLNTQVASERDRAGRSTLRPTQAHEIRASYDAWKKPCGSKGAYVETRPEPPRGADVTKPSRRSGTLVTLFTEAAQKITGSEVKDACVGAQNRVPLAHDAPVEHTILLKAVAPFVDKLLTHSVLHVPFCTATPSSEDPRRTHR